MWSRPSLHVRAARKPINWPGSAYLLPTRLPGLDFKLHFQAFSSSILSKKAMSMSHQSHHPLFTQLTVKVFFIYYFLFNIHCFHCCCYSLNVENGSERGRKKIWKNSDEGLISIHTLFLNQAEMERQRSTLRALAQVIPGELLTAGCTLAHWQPLRTKPQGHLRLWSASPLVC